MDPAMAENLARVVATNANDEHYFRDIELARLSEEAAKATLARVCAEAASPRSVLDVIDGRVPPRRAAAAAPVAAQAPTARAPAAPTSAKLTDAQLQAMADAFWAEEAQSGRQKVTAPANDFRPRLYGQASPSLARLIRSRGGEPLSPPAGSYYLPPSAANAIHATPEAQPADGYTGAASRTMRALLASRGQRPADDLR